MNKATVTSNNEKEKQDMNSDNLAYLNGSVSQHFHNLKKLINKSNIEIRKDCWVEDIVADGRQEKRTPH